MAQPKTVLVVEDNLDLNEIIQEFLEAYGFRVVSAKDGAEGLRLFEEKRPDIVLSDVLLPKLNGFGLCEKVKRGGHPVPVVLMSALYKTYSLQIEAKTKYGADEYLIKPLNLMAVGQKLCNLLGIEKPDKATLLEAAETITETDAPDVVHETSTETVDDEPIASDEPFSTLALDRDVPAQGDLGDIAIKQLLGHLFSHEQTGKLRVVTDKIARTVYLKDGVPRFVTSNAPDETFARLLLAEEVLSPRELAAAEKKAKSEKTTLGKVLVNEQKISNDQLADYLLREVDLRLDRLLVTKLGTYTMTDDETWLAQIKRPEVNVFDAVYRAIVDQNDVQALQARYQPMLDRVIEKDEKNLALAGRIEWQDRHLAAFILIDSERDGYAVIAESGQDETTVLELLYTLELFGMIRFR